MFGVSRGVAVIYFFIFDTKFNNVPLRQREKARLAKTKHLALLLGNFWHIQKICHTREEKDSVFMKEKSSLFLEKSISEHCIFLS